MINKQHLPQMDDDEQDTYEYIQHYHEEQSRYEYEKYYVSNIEGD